MQLPRTISLYNAGHWYYKGCLWPMNWNATGV
jgi:hypothetical protein